VLTIVVLAAGRSERFGSNKLLHELPEGGTLLERAIRACGEFSAIAICGKETEARARELRIETILNEFPDRGMSYSLRLAHAAIDPRDDIAVLPADLRAITAESLSHVIELAQGVDVTYPARADKTPGHPVIFSARARKGIEELGDNAPISQVRDHPTLSRRIIPIEDPWPYQDIDRVSDL